MPHFIATCAKDLEYLLVDELKALGVENPKEGLSQVKFETDWKGVYRVLMWSRIASRIHYPIATFEATNDDMLYQHASIIDWSQHLSDSASFLINAQSFRSQLSHTQFISQRVKDAIVDYFREAGQSRPDVTFDEPDVVIHCRIKRNQVTLSIDLAGQGLHKRGYRLKGGGAPIKENLAAALLMRAGWTLKETNSLYDPMCGSGTFLIEGAMMSYDIAPGLLREYLGLFGWNQFNQTLWGEIIEEAEFRREKGLEQHNLSFIGSDINPKAVRNAQMNIALIGLEDRVKIHIGGLDQVEQLDLPNSGILIVNPPYSERLGERNQVKQLYAQLGLLLKERFIGWKASVLSPDKDFGHALGIRAKKIYKFNNASIPCELLNFELMSDNFIERVSESQVETDFKEKLTPQAIQLCHRLEKNRSKLKKYLAKENISCYRIYDADLPDYNAAIDVYDNRLHIQEYRPPKSVDDKLATRRLKEIERVAAGVFAIPRNQVYVKQRRQQKGDWQYQVANNQTSQSNSNNFTVTEGGRRFIVNLNDYLDTGLFLDHRQTREMVAKKVSGKSFLNLFCYTGSVSVYAATAGASSTTNVDMSRTYLEWAKQNYIKNEINISKHEFIRENCLVWLEEACEQKLTFDLIFLDPPTFSNSKRMENHFDIQADHPKLIQQCLQLLNKNGQLIFSNNFQKFEMLVSSDEQVEVKEITKQTITPDFSRRSLHRCWLISNKS
ncbi:bifunctional 23S rRNA (guanine(2069)-N(7))-methyltransferase RlmK/23S rRNA (guanine(2445)-N(2))-methyltransferase RlmL [Aliikangiella sp. IMCC44359]|uniref:bifunctional 23S rRNA (guanine(2069)-N(7))-methyltransferase RlmK/23S rRNA (guanine(2445)-N(2))-methyltransferase RlmL n=1 Tax=Aliikangiella sp. IMCC44359 TaxID=3459125 RepID=UPI00403B28C2